MIPRHSTLERERDQERGGETRCNPCNSRAAGSRAALCEQLFGG